MTKKPPDAGATRAPGRVKEVTSLSNPIVKDIRALALKKNRDRDRAFLAEGLKLVMDAFEAGWNVRTLVHAKSARGNQAVERAAARAVASGAMVLEVPEKVLGAITRRDNPQMVAAVIGQRLTRLSDIRPAGEEVWIALDRVRDPGNLGTIIRTVDAVGASGVILVGDCTDPFSLEAVRATMGSLFSVRLARASQEEFLAWRGGAGALFVGTHLEGSTDYRRPDYAGRPVVLVMGNEQQGLPDALASACDTLVRIAQPGRADSLNLAVATAIMLYEARRHALPDASTGSPR